MKTPGKAPGRTRRWLLPAVSAAVVALTPAIPAAMADDGGGAAKIAACTDGTTVTTDKGPVCGTIADGVKTWLGVPYAAPPLANLRWAAPQPHAAWTTPIQATEQGQPCAQPQGLGNQSTNEDCLKVNITAPQNATGPLPVMVELHGGGFRFGGPSDGKTLVKAGPVIHVGVRYRLNVMGFLTHKGFGEHAGNYAFRDQQAALRWVQTNIAKFGGDPKNVTIFGASAGGSSVCANAVSPGSKGLFQKGIPQSGEYNSRLGNDVQWQPQDCAAKLPTEAEAQAAGDRFAAAVGCGNVADAAACLRAVPVEKLLQQAGGGVGANVGTQGPVVDGEVLPQSPGQAFADGNINDIVMMHGVNRDETQLPAATTPEQYKTNVQQQYGPIADQVMKLYPIERFPDPTGFIAYRTIVADSNSVCPALVIDQRMAKKIKVYAWQNDNADAPPMFFLDKTKPNGAYHISESAFLSPLPNQAALTPNQAALAAQVVSQWTGFARTGTPEVPGTPAWTPFTTSDNAVLSLVSAGDSELTREISQQHHCDFWSKYVAFKK
ncbi:carboxylesterase/lipase family protein [Actinomadura decatromicini]|uniref:Carboxylic ester hydrolase n=1 Tax=Actinomadura decatromicini TaxID=2604572 RepID=A0A5D3G011_9ACTN|nr:carboxylesterase family protein [Actinomadura decatromicini]TYK52795.1 carboxylesterase family protein [Actinomadura decatromicini]